MNYVLFYLGILMCAVGLLRAMGEHFNRKSLMLVGDILIFLFGVWIAISALCKAKEDDAISQSRFDEQINRLRIIVEGINKSDKDRDSQFEASLTKLKGIVGSLEDQERAKMKDLKVRLGLSYQKILSLGTGFDGELRILPYNDDKLKKVGVELLTVLNEELPNPYLIKEKRLYPFWKKYRDSLADISFRISGGYGFEYQNIFDRISYAHSDFKDSTQFITIDINGNIRNAAEKIKK